MRSGGQGRGKPQSLEELRGDWREDGTGCPPLSTAAVSWPPLPESGRQREMMDDQASLDACNTERNNILPGRKS